jgi:hypothetical protein
MRRMHAGSVNGAAEWLHRPRLDSPAARMRSRPAPAPSRRPGLAWAARCAAGATRKLAEPLPPSAQRWAGARRPGQQAEGYSGSRRRGLAWAPRSAHLVSKSPQPGGVKRVGRHWREMLSQPRGVRRRGKAPRTVDGSLYKGGPRGSGAPPEPRLTQAFNTSV